jgi:hypothetical protein
MQIRCFGKVMSPERADDLSTCDWRTRHYRDEEVFGRNETCTRCPMFSKDARAEEICMFEPASSQMYMKSLVR